MKIVRRIFIKRGSRRRILSGSWSGDLLQRAFAGSASQLMMHALAGKKTSQEEIAEIRELLDEYERKAK